MCYEHSLNFSVLSNGERIRNADFTVAALWKMWTDFSFYLSLNVLGFLVYPDSIVLPLYLFCIPSPLG